MQKKVISIRLPEETINKINDIRANPNKCGEIKKKYWDQRNNYIFFSLNNPSQAFIIELALKEFFEKYKL